MPKIKLPRYLPFILLLSFAVNLFLLYHLKLANLHLVTRVSDGDTIVLDNSQVVRLANLDAPEYDTCGGSQSKNFLENLILGKKVSFKGLGYDEFNRTLAIIYLKNQSINQLLVSSGWADYDSNFKDDRQIMSDLAIMAKRNQSGIYSLCRSQTSPEPNCLIKANNHNRTKIYFLPNCSNYKNTTVETDKGDQWFCTEEDAKKAGYKKSGDCR